MAQIQGYLRPQQFIREVLQQLPNVDSVSLHAFVFGPQFSLFRYTNAIERAAMKGTAFAKNTNTNPANEQLVAYEGLSQNPGLVVDKSFVKLYAENLEGELFSASSDVATTLANKYDFTIPSLSTPNQLLVASIGADITAHVGATAISSGNYQLVSVTVNEGGQGYTPSSTILVPIVDPLGAGSGAVALLTVNSSGVVASGVIVSPGAGYTVDVTTTIPGQSANIGRASGLIPELFGRPVQAGDVLYATLGGTTVRRIVQGVAQQLQPASVGSSNNRQFVAASSNPALAASASFAGVSHPFGWSVGYSNLSSWNGLTQGSYYQGQYGDHYTITCIASGTTNALFRVRSASGGFTADNISASSVATVSGNQVYTFTDTSLGGLTLTLTAPGSAPFTTGMIFGFSVFGAYTPLDLAPTGALLSVSALQGGTGFSAGTIGDGVLHISAPPAGGVQATAHISAVSAGAIETIAIDNPGSGYAYPPLITATGGTGAVLKAVIATTNNSCNLAIVDGTGYNGTTNNRYAITVVQGSKTGGSTPFNGAVLRITDTAGVDITTEVTVTEGSIYNLGSYGLQFTLPTGDKVATVQQTGLRAGDVYYIDVVAPAAGGAYNTIVCPGALTDITGWAPSDVASEFFNIDLRFLFTGAVPQQGDPADAPVLSWVANSGSIQVKYNLKVFVAGRSDDNQWVPVQNSAYAYLYSHWRGLVVASGTKLSPTRYYSTSAIQATYGANDIDNPLCFAACIAFNGAQGKSIFASGLPSNDLAGYTAVLNQAARIQGPYSLVPTTQDPAVIDLVQTHVDTCSLYNNKLWRRAYVTRPTGGAYAITNQDVDGNPLLATVLTDGTTNVRVVCSNALFIVDEVQSGDVLRTSFTADAWGNPSYVEYPIQTVLENNELILTNGPANPITSPVRIEIWRPATATNLALHMGQFAETLGDRRMCVVWVDEPTILDPTGTFYVVTPVWNVAAEIAGLRSALLPQQGLTYTQLQYSLVAAPNMYAVYQQSDLDLAASYGVMIVTQEIAGGPIFIRHQLTTNVGNGSLYYEDSVGTNFDFIAYTFKAALQPYIGQRNATPQVVEELDVRLKTILDGFKKNPPVSAASSIGPAIIDWKNLTVAIDPNFRDRIIWSAGVVLPLPLNILDGTLNGSVLEGDVSITTASSTPVSTS